MKRILLVVALFIASSVAVVGQCSTFPCVVASISLPHQTAAIAPTTLLTASSSSTFRVNYYLSTGAGVNDGHDWATYIRWTDEQGPRSIYTQVGAHGSNAPYASVIVHVAEGESLEYRTAVLGNRDANTPKVYDLYIVVEQLQ